jgi:hypothetical protein
MVAVRLLLAAIAVHLTLAADANARCQPCTVGESGCVPKGGILVFASVRPNVPVGWTMFASHRRPLGRLRGRLDAWSDAVDPGVPGFPGQARDDVYRGRSARFRGTADAARVQGVATYADGSTCDFATALGFGLGGATPNAFVCRDATGVVVAQGAVDLQGIRLRGCRPPAR